METIKISSPEEQATIRKKCVKIGKKKMLLSNQLEVILTEKIRKTNFTIKNLTKRRRKILKNKVKKDEPFEMCFCGKNIKSRLVECENEFC